MSTPIRPIELELDLGQAKDEALRYLHSNPDVRLNDFLRLYPAQSRQALPQNHLQQALKHFLIIPIHLKPGAGLELKPDGPAAGTLRSHLGELYRRDLSRGVDLDVYPERITDLEAVKIAYRHELEAIARFLMNDLSVLIQCDKTLTEHIYEYVCHQAGKDPILNDMAFRGEPVGPRAAIERATQGGQSGRGMEAELGVLIRTYKEGQILVLRSMDILDTPGLTEVLYQNSGSGLKPQLLGFQDPSLEIRKVLTDRFAIRFSITGMPRYIQPDPDQSPIHTVTRLITARERQCFRTFDPEGLYKNVSGLNVIQFRNAMRYVGATVALDSPPRKIYDVIRQFKTSSSDEIAIPDTDFDDIGGYEHIKRDLQRIVALATGRVKGIDEDERKKLIPRGFVFHGPSGTGKTLFAKAIANEMNATIQMVSGPEIMDKYVGQSESNLRHIFTTARRNAPSVIFFDEFDSIAMQRSAYADGGARVNNAVVAQLLTELDGFREDQAVLVIGTTNRLDIIDEALMRPSRLRPVEIGLPNYDARRAVARIHCRKFGVEKLLCDLGQLAYDYLPDYRPDEPISPSFLDALFAQHPMYEMRYEDQSAGVDFVQDLKDFITLFQQVRTKSDSTDSAQSGNRHLPQLEKRLLEIAGKYGLDLKKPDPKGSQVVDTFQPMYTDLRELFRLVRGQSDQDGGFSRETFMSGVLDLVADHTEGFNNDEIRAIFQECSLDHHLEGQLITPMYLASKAEMIRKRRDERDHVHLSTTRGRN